VLHAAATTITQLNTTPNNHTITHSHVLLLCIAMCNVLHCVGEVAVLGLEEFEETGKFGAFWLRKGEVIGAFLEGGEQSDIQAILKV
jgi:hypothetical protein